MIQPAISSSSGGGDRSEGILATFPPSVGQSPGRALGQGWFFRPERGEGQRSPEFRSAPFLIDRLFLQPGGGSAPFPAWPGWVDCGLTPFLGPRTGDSGVFRHRGTVRYDWPRPCNGGQMLWRSVDWGVFCTIATSLVENQTDSRTGQTSVLCFWT
jgi:hypothetical protein